MFSRISATLLPRWFQTWGPSMAKVVLFHRWQMRHALASKLEAVSRSLACNSAKVSSVKSWRSRPLASRTSPNQCDAGIEPRARQLLTVDRLSPKQSATTAVPPAASIASLIVQTMPSSIVRSVRTSQQFATHELHFSSARGALVAMSATIKQIANRLIATRLALDFEEQQAFCEEIGVKKNVYNPFEKGRRRITIDVALKIKRRFGISLDWIYDGERHKLPADLHAKLKQVA